MHLWLLLDELRHQVLTPAFIQNDDLDAILLQQLLSSDEVHVLANDDARNLVQQYCAGAHDTRAAMIRVSINL